jgi:uncharacterized protein (DUF2336 family)
MVAPSQHLTLADVQRLIDEPSAEARADTAARVAQVFAAPSLTERERAIAQDVLSTLACDTEVQVRRALAENVKDNPDLPPELAKRLARDVAEVATPILEFSTVFSDDELLSVIFAESNQHQAAIARRKQVPEHLSAALVECGDENVVATLMQNTTAVVADKTVHRALDRFGAVEQVNAAIVHRPQHARSVVRDQAGVDEYFGRHPGCRRNRPGGGPGVERGRRAVSAVDQGTGTGCRLCQSGSRGVILLS